MMCSNYYCRIDESKLFPKLENKYGEIAGYPPPGPPLGIDGWKPKKRTPKLEAKQSISPAILYV